MARQRHDTDATELSRPSVDACEGSPARLGSKPAPGLYLVATPIGNMGDITLRAIETLKGADVIACEDTRVTSKLLIRLGLDRPLFPYHEHNADQAGPKLLARLREGKVVALASDAGTPLVSDPGFRLVQACIAENLPVTALPGASAVLTALQLSGLPAERWLFAGFLPSKATQRRQTLRELEHVPATLIFYESPNRLADSLADMEMVLGMRDAAVARELTKRHEEVVRGPLSTLANRYATAATPKGEVVVVVAPPAEAEPCGEQDVEARLRREVEAGISVKDAAALVAAETGHPRREIYARALKLFRGDNE